MCFQPLITITGYSMDKICHRVIIGSDVIILYCILHSFVRSSSLENLVHLLYSIFMPYKSCTVLRR